MLTVFAAIFEGHRNLWFLFCAYHKLDQKMPTFHSLFRMLREQNHLNFSSIQQSPEDAVKSHLRFVDVWCKHITVITQCNLYYRLSSMPCVLRMTIQIVKCLVGTSIAQVPLYSRRSSERTGLVSRSLHCFETDVFACFVRGAGLEQRPHQGIGGVIF